MSTNNPENKQSSYAGFKSVDNTTDPKSYVKYLEAVSELEPIKDYKQVTYNVLDIQDGDLILDAGCGIGIDAKKIAEIYSVSVIGLDSSASMIESAQEMTSTELFRSERVKFCVGDLNDLPFKDATFSSVRADRTFQYFADPKRAMEELVRVTKPKGGIVTADPNWESLRFNGLSRSSVSTIQKAFLNIIPSPFVGRDLRNLSLRKCFRTMVSYRKSIELDNASQVRLVLFLESSLRRAIIGGILNDDQVSESLEEFRETNPTKISGSFDIHIIKGVRK